MIYQVLVCYSSSYLLTHWWKGLLGLSWFLALAQYAPNRTVISLLFPLLFTSFICVGFELNLFIFQVLSIPLLASYPCIALLSGFCLSIALNCASMLKNVLSVSLFLKSLCSSVSNIIVDWKFNNATCGKFRHNVTFIIFF